MRQIRPRYLVLLLSILMIFSGITTAWLVQNSFGSVITTEIDFSTHEGVNIHSTLQVPRVASESHPLPGVVVIHGVYQSKEWLRAFGIELSRRGFVVLTIDAASHGNSGYAEYESDRGGAAALEYLNSLEYVSNLGIIGHSMGAGIAIQALELTTLTIDALVFIGGGSRNIDEWANSTYPKNLLITIGKYDELFDIPSLRTSLASTFNKTTSITSGRLYGSFSDGTARKLVIGQTNHLFEIIDPIIVCETVEWLKESLKGSGNDPHWIPKKNLVFPIHFLGGLISSLGILLSFFPVLSILIDLPFFQSLKKNPSSSYYVNNRRYWLFGGLYAFISLGLFIPALLLPLFPFPQNMGSSVGVWLIGSSTISLIVLYFIYRYHRINANQDFTQKDFGVDFSNLKETIPIFGRSALMAFLVVLWAYLWMMPFDVVLALDFSAFLPLFNDLPLAPPRLLIAPLYLIFTIPFFLVEGMWLIGLLRTNPKDTWVKTQFSWSMRAVLIKIIPYILILLIQLTISFLIGSPFVSGILGFYLLFLWMFIPFFIITTFFTTWSYHLTRRVYISAVLNALIVSWTLASILTLTM